MALEFKDYYKILGVARNADDKAIKSAYRKLARKHHPDVAKDKDSGARFREVAEAYEVLSDPEKRQRYDTLGPDWQRYAQPGPAGQGGPGGGGRVEYADLGDFSDFFRSIFGNQAGRPGGNRPGRDVDIEDWLGGYTSGGRGASRGHDVQANVSITLEEAYSGTRKSFEFEVEEACPTCHGSGNVGGKPCATCHGSGWQSARREVDVRIPAGVRTGQKVRVSGGGARGGDLYLAVTVTPHRELERRGDDIQLTVPITAPEAALGVTLEIPTLRGKVSMKIPPATSSGRTFRLPGYGMAKLKGGGHGNQMVTVRIVMPADLRPEERELYEKLKALRSDSPRSGYAQG
jgi:DnaJ-class molecular chaperone